MLICFIGVGQDYTSKTLFQNIFEEFEEK